MKDIAVYEYDVVFMQHDAVDEPVRLIELEPLTSLGDIEKLDIVMKMYKTDSSHYEMVFAAGRSMFCGMEIKGGNGGNKFSEMKDDYGIVPMPKYSEDQAYVSPIAVWTHFMTVPVTNTELDETSIILDAMSYLSYRDIVPKYYDVVLQLKHIRDDETSEMLDIIRDARTYYTAYAFGLGSNLRSQLASAITTGKGGAASIVAANQASIEAEITSLMEALNSK